MRREIYFCSQQALTQTHTHKLPLELKEIFESVLPKKPTHTLLNKIDFFVFLSVCYYSMLSRG